MLQWNTNAPKRYSSSSISSEDPYQERHDLNLHFLLPCCLILRLGQLITAQYLAQVARKFTTLHRFSICVSWCREWRVVAGEEE